MVVLLLFLLGSAAPRLVREDGVFESVTAAAFGGAALIAAWICGTRWRGMDALERLCLAVAGVVAGLAALSEVSFGARFFGWSMPAMPGGGQLDGIHDLVIIAVRWSRAATTEGFVLAAASVLVLSAWIVFASRKWLWALLRRTLRDTVFFALALTGVLLAAAVGLDAAHSRRLEVLEEALETAAGLVLLLALGTHARRR